MKVNGRAPPPVKVYDFLKKAKKRRRWKAARKELTKKPRRIIPRPERHAPPTIPEPIRPINRMTAEMWEDYRAFKAAGLLSEWRRKWAVCLPG